MTTAAQPSTTSNCRFCWMCRHVCPVGHVTHRETFTPHAWALTIESVARGQLTWNEDSVGVMYACADCGLCRAHCVTDQPLPDAIVAARTEIAASGRAPASVYALDDAVKAARRTPAREAAPAGSAGLFAGESGAAHPAVRAAMALAAAAGLSVVPVGDARPTGLQANSVGLGPTARQLAQDVVDEIAASGVREVLVLSPGDRWTFEYVYPVRLGVAWPAGVRVTELTTALAEAVADRRLQFSPRADARPFAYHDPCHTARTARDGAAVRSLLAAVLGDGERRLFWREGRAHPCGAIGGLELTHPDIAAGLADARLAEAASAGAEWLVTEDPLCAAHLAGRGASRLEVKSLFELLAAALPSPPDLRYS